MLVLCCQTLMCDFYSMFLSFQYSTCWTKTNNNTESFLGWGGGLLLERIVYCIFQTNLIMKNATL